MSSTNESAGVTSARVRARRDELAGLNEPDVSDLDTLLAAQARRHVADRLRRVSLTDMQVKGTSAAVRSHLRRSGFETAADIVDAPDEALLAVRGVGDVILGRLRTAADEHARRASDVPASLPLPDAVGADDLPLLAALAARLRQGRVPASLLEALDTEAEAIGELEQAAERLHRRRWLPFGRSTRAAELERVELDLAARVESTDVDELLADADSAWERHRLPDSPDGLLEEYRRRYTDYVAVHERSAAQRQRPRRRSGPNTGRPDRPGRPTDGARPDGQRTPFLDRARNRRNPRVPSGPPPSGIARRAERARAAARAQPTTQAWVPEHRQPSVRGGLPAEIAERVEAVDIVTPGLDVVLRPYQEFGTAFALLQKRVVLGDEMGLGKTIEALALVAHLAAAEGATRFVVVAPASIVGNWHLEATGRLDTIAVHLAHGPARRHAVTRWVERGGVLLTSYTTLRSIEYDIAGEAIDLVVGDEAHYLKNPDAQRTRATARVMGNAERVLLMTGTPMENRADEFVNLVRLLDGARADALTDRRFATPTVALDFRRDVAPVYLRRNQEDVLHELPDRIESIEWIDLGHRERQQYWDAVETSHIAHVRRAVSVGLGTESAKLRRLRELLDEYRADGQRVIVFSFFLDVLDAVEEMAGRSWRIDGSVPPARRMDIIAEFSAADPYGGAVMVSQISAGGIGVNLQAASAVIIVEPQYKPTTEWQAIARAHRMGQTRPVHVHRLIARDTVDESLMSLLATKEQRFDDYARESTVKDSSAKAVATDSPSDTALSAELMRIETERRAAA